MSSTTPGNRAPRLGWFFHLGIDEQIAVLTDPYTDLPAPAAGDRSEPFEKNTGPPPRYRLSAQASQLLRSYRDRLTRWWQTLSPEQQTALIDHRDDGLPHSFHAVLFASDGVLTKYQRHPLTGETEAWVFPTPMTRAFLEWQARLQTHPE